MVLYFFAEGYDLHMPVKPDIRKMLGNPILISTFVVHVEIPFSHIVGYTFAA